MTQIKIHQKQDFQAMRETGQIAAKTLDFITPKIKPGISTQEINDECHNFIIKHGAIPAPLNYKGFPKSICTSVNHIICHGIPSEQKILKNGDILNIDVTTILNGWHGDTSRMFTVGNKINTKAQKLINTTYKAMMKAIHTVKPKNRFGHIGHTIQTYAENKKYSVVRDFCGHGLGKTFHDAPNVMHYGKPDDGAEFQKGMFFTIEPMINIGTYEVLLLKDGWTAVTRDRKLSAQFEHSIGVTENGYEIFTESPKGWHCPPYD